MNRSSLFQRVRNLFALLITVWICASILFFFASIAELAFLANRNLLPWSGSSSIAVDQNLRVYVYSDFYEQILVYDLREGGRFLGSIPGIVRKGRAGIGVTSDGQVVVCSGQFAKFVSLSGEGKAFESRLPWPDWRYEGSEILTAVPEIEGAGGTLASVGDIVCNPNGVKRFRIDDQVEVSLSFLGIATAEVEGRHMVISAPWMLWLIQIPFPFVFILLSYVAWAFFQPPPREDQLPVFWRTSRKAPPQSQP